MTNKFAGVCKCKCPVAAEAGSVSKVRGKWAVTCSTCSTGSKTTARPVSERVMDGSIEWPNGWGYTECTAEYADPVCASRQARDALEEFDEQHGYDENHRGRIGLYNASCRASEVVLQLQADGGHMGERVTYDAPDGEQDTSRSSPPPRPPAASMPCPC